MNIELKIEDDCLVAYALECDEEGREFICNQSSIHISEIRKVLQKLDAEENIKINKFEQWKNSQ